MKKCFLLILNFVATVSLAQTVFLPNIGTKWHYGFGNSFNGIDSNHKIEYISDSISTVTGEKIKKLLATKILANDNSSNNKYVFIKQRNDSVWFKHAQTNNSWQLLINYNATVAQTWTYSVMSGTYTNIYNITVNAVGTVTINNQSLKELKVTCNYGSNTYTTTICERMGFMNFLFNSSYYNPATPIDGAYVKYFLCYEDSTFGLKQFTNYPCNYPYSLSLKENSFIQTTLNLYPNPTSDVLNLEMKNFASAENICIKIVNLLGQNVMDCKFEKTLNISGLLTGIYFLQLFDRDKLIATEKIIKE